MSDWEDWLVEWQAWTACIFGAKEVNGVDGKRPDIAEDWGDRVPEFMDFEL